MTFYVGKCNHCSTDKIRFDVLSYCFDPEYDLNYFFINCENCNTPTVLSMKANDVDVEDILKKKEFPLDGPYNISEYFYNERIINTPSDSIARCPEHVPNNLKLIFDEAALCYSHNCYIACASMFRLCLDMTTKELLNEWLEANQGLADQPNSSQKDKLYNRIEFLIERGVIPKDLKDYAHHIRLDGNDAAHDGSTEKEEAEDLLDFSELFLERIYTMKKQLDIAQARRLARRTK
jgi:hypothetical protein